jgi:hypothetical protein
VLVNFVNNIELTAAKKQNVNNNKKHNTAVSQELL